MNKEKPKKKVMSRLSEPTTKKKERPSSPNVSNKKALMEVNIIGNGIKTTVRMGKRPQILVE